MPVTVNEIAKIVDIEGKEHEGRAVGTDIVCLETEAGLVYGKLVKLVRLETTIVCDNPKCEHGEVDQNFHTHPKTISFTEQGNTDNPKFIQELADVMITSDYQGNKLVFCTLDCLSAYTKRQARQAQVVQMPNGKGTRTFRTGEDEVVPMITPTPEEQLEAKRD